MKTIISNSALRILLITSVLFSFATTFAHDFEVDGIYYNIKGNEAMVTYRGPDYFSYSDEYYGNVSIPTTVTYNGMYYPVTAIGNAAFYDCGELTSITLPNTITSISNNTFFNCSRLTNINIPNSVTVIGDSAFFGCSRLNKVNSNIVYPSLITIGKDVFYQNPSNYAERTLHVPFGSIAAYQAIRKWNSCFDNIVESAPTTDNTFTIGGFEYTITSDTTVTVTDTYYSEEIEIPSHVKYLDVDYIVTAIGDNALNIDAYCITIPETVTSIGKNEFEGYLIDYDGVHSLNLICLAKTPPIMDEISSNANINLFVLEEAYPLYEEINNQYHYFSSIHITNGQRSYISCSYSILEHPEFGDPYGCIVNFYSGKNSTFFYKYDITSATGGYPGYSWENGDCIYFISDAICMRQGLHILAFAIEEGYSPSYLLEEWIGGESSFASPWRQYFDFKESGIAYNTTSNGLSVTYCCYTDLCGNQWVPILYSGNIVIPDSVNGQPVTSIGEGAFSSAYLPGEDCFIPTNDSLFSVTLSASIKSVSWYAFGDSPNLAYIKCLGTTPPNTSSYAGYANCQEQELYGSFDEGVLQNTTLYVPMEALEAYKAAEGWKNFQHIIGFTDYNFETDGIYYKVTSDNEVMVTWGDEAYKGVVNIPVIVTFEGVTYDVTGIFADAFANDTLQNLIIPVTISSIDEGAFSCCHVNSLIITGDGGWTAGAIDCDIDNLFIMSGVTGIQGLLANPGSTVYAYSTFPPTCDTESFANYDAELHVPAPGLAAYFTAPYWNYFINIISNALEPTDLKFNNDSLSVHIGNEVSLTSITTPTNATPSDIIWMSSDETIATVDDGVITPVKVGECDIRAYLLDKTAVCHVTVTEIVPTEVTVSPEFAKLEIGSQLTLSATVLPDDATDKAVTWTTSNADVATIDSLGNIMAVGQGECFITATCRENQASCHVIVVDYFVFITLDEHEVKLLPNHMVVLTPSVMPEGTSLVVTSTDPTVAAARMANGKIQVVGIKEGSTLIQVNSTDGYAETDSCLVNVYTQRGDLNCDGFVNISDVTSLITYLLNHDTHGIRVVNADTNNDGKINISDVTTLINHLLGGLELDPKEDEPDKNGLTFTMISVEPDTFLIVGP